MDAEQQRDFIVRALDASVQQGRAPGPVVRRIIQSELFPRDDEPDETYRVRVAALADGMTLGIESASPAGVTSVAGYVSDRPSTPTLDEDLSFIRRVLERFAEGRTG